MVPAASLGMLSGCLFADVAEEAVGEYARRARLTWERIIEQYVIENAQVEPLVSVVATDNWMEFTVRYVVDYKLRRSTRDRLFSRIIEEIESSAGEVRLGSSSLDVGAVPVLNVELVQSESASAKPASPNGC